MLALTFLFVALHSLTAADKVDFNSDIRPILESTCLSCHGETKQGGELRLDTQAAALKGSENGAVLVPGQPDKSSLYTTTTLDPDDDDVMPPKGDPLTKVQTELLKQWIQEGAVWPEDLTLTQVQRINFVKDIQPILEFNCVACHREGEAKGELQLDTYAKAMKGGEYGPVLVPGHPDKSSLYTSTILEADDDDLMPPSNKGGPMPKETTDLLRAWIEQGAYWPEDLVLQARKKELASTVDEAALVARIHARIAANLKGTNPANMRAYTNEIPGVDVRYVMLPIPGGEFVMGSPAAEAGRGEDEGPQHKVRIEPFWMGRCEVTWNQFELFMYPAEERKIAEFLGYTPEKDSPSDAVTRPTSPYVEMSFGMGKDGYPAISMTQHAANKFCQWLSAKTGEYYRLPTEAEWEYACRAGTTTAYSFGDDASQLGDYAWYAKNSNWKYQKVGMKKPNPWGLHDMHGNVVEWCLDQYAADAYQAHAGHTADNPWIKATRPYPHVARGGSWDDDPEWLRSAARRGSDASWKRQDPQLPKSIWYLTDAQFLGFRVVRPLKLADPEALKNHWNSGVEKE